MSKNNSFFPNFILANFLSSSLGICFLIFLLICGGLIFKAVKEVDDEYKKYGYSGYSDNIQYDDWTGEVIPKDEIIGYSNDNKTISNSKGESIKFSQLKELINQYESIQGNLWPIREEKKQALDEICRVLLKDYLDVDYEFVNMDEEGAYKIKLQGKYSNEIVSTSDLKEMVKQIVKDKYKK